MLTRLKIFVHVQYVILDLNLKTSVHEKYLGFDQINFMTHSYKEKFWNSFIVWMNCNKTCTAKNVLKIKTSNNFAKIMR